MGAVVPDPIIQLRSPVPGPIVISRLQLTVAGGIATHRIRWAYRAPGLRKAHAYGSWQTESQPSARPTVKALCVTCRNERRYSRRRGQRFFHDNGICRQCITETHHEVTWINGRCLRGK